VSFISLRRQSRFGGFNSRQYVNHPTKKQANCDEINDGVFLNKDVDGVFKDASPDFKDYGDGDKSVNADSTKKNVKNVSKRFPGYEK